MDASEEKGETSCSSEACLKANISGLASVPDAFVCKLCCVRESADEPLEPAHRVESHPNSCRIANVPSNAQRLLDAGSQILRALAECEAYPDLLERCRTGRRPGIRRRECLVECG